MASWGRASAGAFAAGARMRWDRLRDEFVLWRASLNRIENAQLAAGATFRLGQIAHDATVSSVRFELTNAPQRTVATFTGPLLVPVGGLRIYRPTTIRYATVAMASEGVTMLGDILIAATGGPTQVQIDALPTANMSIRLIDRQRAGIARTGGTLFADTVGRVVAGPVNVSLRLGRTAAGAVTGVSRASDIRGRAPLQLFFSQTRFVAGDVLVAVIDMPNLPGGLLGELDSVSNMRQASVRIEYAMDHG